jgi:hypothetical protein
MSKNIVAILLLSLFAYSAKATVRTCNNNNPSPGQYATLQNAINAANAGDTIYISGSYFSYGSVNVDKKLTIIGTGHNPQKQGPLKSNVDGITFSNANAKNTKLMGLVLGAVYTTAANVDSIYIERNEIVYYIYIPNNGGHDYWFIQGNLFSYTGMNIYMMSSGANSWFIIRNNIFNGFMNDLSYNYSNSSVYLLNNIFLYNGNAFQNSSFGLYIYNNIFYRASPSVSTTGCAWQNNLSYQCANNSFPGGSGNQPNVDPLFVNFPNAGDYHSYSYDFNLQSSSPAINAGNDGKNIGHTGGDFYYEKYGIPSIPQIRAFNFTSSTNIAPGGTLQFNVKSTIKK